MALPQCQYYSVGSLALRRHIDLVSGSIDTRTRSLASRYGPEGRMRSGSIDAGRCYLCLFIYSFIVYFFVLCRRGAVERCGKGKESEGSGGSEAHSRAEERALDTAIRLPVGVPRYGEVLRLDRTLWCCGDVDEGRKCLRF